LHPHQHLQEVKLHSSTTVPSFKFTADRVPFLLQLLPESSGKIKQKNDEAIKTPSLKKGSTSWMMNTSLHKYVEPTL
jgi:hypothetical protein